MLASLACLLEHHQHHQRQPRWPNQKLDPSGYYMQSKQGVIKSSECYMQSKDRFLICRDSTLPVDRHPTLPWKAAQQSLAACLQSPGGQNMLSFFIILIL